MLAGPGDAEDQQHLQLAANGEYYSGCTSFREYGVLRVAGWWLDATLPIVAHLLGIGITGKPGGRNQLGACTSPEDSAPTIGPKEREGLKIFGKTIAEWATQRRFSPQESGVQLQVSNRPVTVHAQPGT
ncbi:hypothetical protein VTN77DRAFT_4394 [Rasamsonia byssochlamydoides]|uniref:uncharacterized protein n=1 Tax=Rasamsonia byssochlamydoides TaxID=89139 RepID=UPI003741F6F0